eukprot:scaffold1795_cov140-Isochrysis_galbana.AAC.4
MGGKGRGREGRRQACCLRPTTFLQMALASSAITAAWERRWEWWCMKERGLEVAHPYRVRSIAEAPDARLERVWS